MPEGVISEFKDRLEELEADAAELVASDEELELSDIKNGRNQGKRRPAAKRGRPQAAPPKAKKSKRSAEDEGDGGGSLPTFKKSTKKFHQDFVRLTLEEAAKALRRSQGVMGSKADKLQPIIPIVFKKWQDMVGGPLYSTEDFSVKDAINLIDNSKAKFKRSMKDIQDQFNVTGSRLSDKMVEEYDRAQGHVRGHVAQDMGWR
ncbi:hypothetical protein VOLCADRAFT_85826 [Volvox carteri f. nagariensis]|uniref:Uncharacterized protein n=1 Tax=Volvox carteri f. nagariensis TaxID=3068 RepID=D8TH35_VOLCA|nr:uncharacterized protein VOLCADRAFT_85826 [Volvox carteri f. nagariensis]EFJ53002.1 hypothetical protein VOLCADRAFT_85826 [Volvox carteri f. nagariensis]|eukprot:XP_002946007.1 hypothetical protein VOLCADRAFT_85826 [Volvox carteri f. nagariensis]